VVNPIYSDKTPYQEAGRRAENQLKKGIKWVDLVRITSFPSVVPGGSIMKPKNPFPSEWIF
jgi:hypothetical protein